MYEPGVEPWEDDIPFLERLTERFSGDDEVRLLADDIPITAFSALLGRFDLMIGMRLHSALIALRMGTPAIHIAYTRKGHAIYAGLGLSDWLVPVETVMTTPALLIDMVRSILASPKSLARVEAVRDTAIAQNRKALLGAVATATGAQT
jgi:polysaccharide pyruvyl transferase WcaK-like protein